MADDVIMFLVYRSGTEGAFSYDFELSGSLDEARSYIDSMISGNKPNKNSEDPGVENRGSFDPRDIEKIQSRFIQHISAYRALIELTGPLEHLLKAATFKKEIVDVAENEYELVEEYKKYKISKVNSSQLIRFDSALDKVIEIGTGLSVLPASNLLSLVATFDSFISDIAFRAVRTKPGLYAEDRKLSLKEIMQMGSFDEVVDHVALQDVQDCMRGSHASQISFLEKVCDTKIASEYERWPQFIEIFERRNLVAHQNLEINKTYLANCKEVGLDISNLEIGSRLSLTEKYLKSAVDVLLEFGILLHYVIWKKKHGRDAVNAYNRLNEIAYNLIKAKNPLVASRVLEFALNKQKRIGADSTIKMMTLNLANSYKKLNDNDKMNAAINSIDWSSSSEKYKIAIAALNEDIERVVAIMPKVAEDSEVGRDGLRSWPIFDAVRECDEFGSAFFRVFGEPLMGPSREVEKIAEVAEVTAEVANAEDRLDTNTMY